MDNIRNNALEIVCVTNGTLELGVGQELYHMEKGDIGFVFPDIIHHSLQDLSTFPFDLAGNHIVFIL